MTLALVDDAKYSLNNKWIVGIELVGPEEAADYLSRNENNRPISQVQVENIIKDIQEGKWELTSQGIGLDVNDVLVDGQNRLLAIVKAGIRVPLIVVRGLAPESRLVVDKNRPRKDQHNLEMYFGVKHASKKTAVINVIVGFFTDTIRPSLRLHEKHEEIGKYEWSFDNIFPLVKPGYASSAPVIAALVFAHRKFPDQTMLFAKTLYARSGDGWGKNSPVFIIDDYLNSNRSSSSGGYNRIDTFKRVCTALRAYVTDKKIQKLHAAGEAVRFFSLDD